MRVAFQTVARFASPLTVALLALVVGTWGGRAAQAQPAVSADGIWKSEPLERLIDANARHAVVDDGQFRPTDFGLFRIDLDRLQQSLNQARPEAAIEPPVDQERWISLPMPDGSFERFTLIEAPVMSPRLAARFPEIRTYRGQGLDDPTASMRLDISQVGLRAQVLSEMGTVIVDPTGVESQYFSYHKRANRRGSLPFECNLAEGGADERPDAQARAARSGEHLRTYRLAVACTGEYAAKFGGTTAGALAAIVTTVNRVTGIYERELSIRLVLVDHNDKLIFTDAATDPFENNDARALIDQSQAEIDAQIGNANYDIGHTFSTGAGGLAGLGVVCKTGEKARGVTGRAQPVGDPFDVDYVAHEMGHQFGGDHTFNGQSGSCSGGTRNPSTAFEPGSGSTIQAYAGICLVDDLQTNSDAYFSFVSLDQIVRYTTIDAGSVPPAVPTGNGIPNVDAGRDFVIPAQTPFTLTASGSDPDGDLLTYCWEQQDLGPAAGLQAMDDGRIPLFRSFHPTSSPARTFPQWSDILNQFHTPGEQLPARARTLHFRATARDGRGGISGDDMTVTVDGASGPFRVLKPDASSVPTPWVNVTWDVARTDQPPIDAKRVSILLSEDGGRTFPTVLVPATLNDGQELVALPSTSGSALRIQVQAADNVFFAVSPTNFQVRAPRASIVVVRHAEKEAGEDPGLTTVGLSRARALSRLMGARRTAAVYATTARRAQETAGPTAVAAALSVISYADVSQLVAELHQVQDGRQVLVVGHSNTVGPIIQGLGVAAPIDIGEEFDNFFVIGLTDGEPTFEHWKYSPGEELREEAVGLNPARRPEIGVVSNDGFTDHAAPREVSLERGVVLEQVELSRAAAPDDRFARSSMRVRYLRQNWSPDESLEFYALRQGSPILRKEVFDALEQPTGTGLFSDPDYLASFGFLGQRIHSLNPDGYPVGFVGTSALEIACAACHTSRITYQGQEYRIDGSQAMADVDGWLAELVRALKSTLADAPAVSELERLRSNDRVSLDPAKKFDRFAARLLGSSNPAASRIYAVLRMLQQDYERRQRYNDYNNFGRRIHSEIDRGSAIARLPHGYSRLDALGAILNQACAEDLGLDVNAAPANAPVNFPAIWDAPQHTHVQWNGAVDNTSRFGPLGRNVGQVLGVFGIVDVGGDAVVGYDSSVRFDALDRAEELITSLWSPEWPTEFGRDEALVAAGRPVYKQHCAHCHAPMKRDDPHRRAHDVLVPIGTPFGGYPPLDTDALAASNWSQRRARVGPLASRFVTLPLGDAFPDNPDMLVPGRDILTHLVFRVIARSFVPWREELTLDDAPRGTAFATNEPPDELLRYKARPLNGVWSTAPYLHNGSVLNMSQLLKPPSARLAGFHVGTVEYDPDNMGYLDGGPYFLDTSLPGNSNTGHTYGVDLPDDDKRALLEFLKSL